MKDTNKKGLERILTSCCSPLHRVPCCNIYYVTASHLLIIMANDPSKGSRTPTKSRASLLKHKTRSPGESVRESEKSLQKLLEDFEDGKLNAFGKSTSAN